MSRELVIALAMVGALGLAFRGGQTFERSGWEARVAAAEERYRGAQAEAAEAAAALEVVESERAELARQLEEAADADVDAGRIGLPSRSMQRIGAR